MSLLLLVAAALVLALVWALYSVECPLVLKTGFTETLTGDFVDSSNATVGVNGMNFESTINATSTVPGTKGTAFAQALTAGAATINLAALPGLTAEETIVGTGLKVQVAHFHNPATNANAISITVGASNGYDLSGSDFKLTLQPGQRAIIFGNDATPDVASGDRTLDLAGTGSQALNCQFILG